MGRLPYWNIHYGVVIDLLALPVITVWGYRFYHIWKRITAGKARVNSGLGVQAHSVGPFYLKNFITRGVLGSKIYAKPFSGIAHGGLFWGMILLGLGSCMVLLQVVFGIPVLEGGFNRWFMSFTLDAAGLAALAGLAFLFIRRLLPPERLTVYKTQSDFLKMELLLAVIIISGFVLEGLRISANGPDSYSVAGNFMAGWFTNCGNKLVVHRCLWWAHGLMAITFLLYVPYTALVHLVLAPVNTGLALPVPGPRMGVLDFSAFEDEESEETPVLGVARLSDFSWKRLLDFETCLWCGRCHEVCPAAQTGKALSPKKIMVTLAESLKEGRMEDACVGKESITASAVFACTTCAACMEVCPVSVNQPKTIMRLRQNLLMEQSEIPGTMGQANKSLEARRHPFFGTAFGPADWRKGIETPIFKQGQTEYLLWIGCAATYEERSQKIARAMVGILLKAGVSFGILKDPRCTGDPAKQMGNEFLFREFAKDNIEELASLGVKKIITLCPHCFNSLSRHYPPLGGNFDVIPHSVFLKKLIEERKIEIKKREQSICFHDPCYLGRRNHVYSAPREVLSGAGKCVEMPGNRTGSFCCGGGGGNYWAEEEGTRINKTRAKEAFETSTDIIATACPFCLLMLTDGLKGLSEQEKVFDIAEIVSRAMI